MDNPIRNAYLIMAQSKWEQFKLLMRLSDDANNDFYVHIDKKSKMLDAQNIKKSITPMLLQAILQSMQAIPEPS